MFTTVLQWLRRRAVPFASLLLPASSGKIRNLFIITKFIYYHNPRIILVSRRSLANNPHSLFPPSSYFYLILLSLNFRQLTPLGAPIGGG